jgi:hypothetical protein
MNNTIVIANCLPELHHQWQNEDDGGLRSFLFGCKDLATKTESQ